MTDDENDGGYNEWLSSNENINNAKASNISQMNAIIESKKEKCKRNDSA